MSDKNAGKTLLENAYQLQSPDDNIAYYAGMAKTYDADFADGLGYALPSAVAERYQLLSTDNDAPLIDVGCGTGLLADELDNENLIIDGLDISDAMLAVAQEKKRYRRLLQIDLTQPLDSELPKYGAVVSSGTFTHGHLGPDAMVRLFDLAKKHALFILSINKQHYRHLGFESVVTALVKESKISDLQSKEMNIYSVAGHEHSNDKSLIVSFRTV